MRQRWVLIALAVSVATNLFLVGFAASRLLPEPAAAFRPGVAGPWSGIPIERRREIRAWLFEQGRRARADLQPAREHRRIAAERFAANPYEPAAVAAELEQAAAIEAQVRRRVQTDLLQYAGRLTPAERRAMGLVVGRSLLRTGRRGGEGPRWLSPDPRP